MKLHVPSQELCQQLKEAGFQKRFWSKVKKAPYKCWDWQGSTNSGYGQIMLNYKGLLAHRVSYTLLVGEIPKGKQIDHLCRNRACVNPGHLELVTIKENVLRGIGVTAKNAKATHCKNGHEFDAKNTHIDKRGHRICRKCKSLTQQKRHKRKMKENPGAVRQKDRERWQRRKDKVNARRRSQRILKEGGHL